LYLFIDFFTYSFIYLRYESFTALKINVEAVWCCGRIP